MSLFSELRNVPKAARRRFNRLRNLRGALRVMEEQGDLPEHHFRAAAYFADTPTNLYQIRQWYKPLEALSARYPVILVLRSAKTATIVQEETSLPILFARRISEISEFLEHQAIDAVFYVNQHRNNFQMLGERGPAHVHLSHGESDKVSMVSNKLKAYDYIFTAGQAARERINGNLFGRDMTPAFVDIGRPQLDFIPPPPEEFTKAERTVLYAPTWEGETPDMAYTSVVTHGVALIRSLIADPDVGVIFRPHPRTGVVDPAAREAVTEIRRLLQEDIDRGKSHLLDPTTSFDWQLAAADACICDVSAVAFDWASTKKPLLIAPPEAEGAHLEPGGLMSQVPQLSSHEAPRAAEIIRGLAKEGVHEEYAAVAAHYFGDSSPGASLQRWLTAAGEVITHRRRSRLRDSGLEAPDQSIIDRDASESGFPPGTHYALTWLIPQDFGGLTTAMINRSTAINREPGARSAILTIGPDQDPALIDKLHASGALPWDVPVRNLWFDLQTWSDESILAMTESGAPGELYPEDLPSGQETLRFAPDGTLLQRTHFRSDGRVLATDRRDTKKRGNLGGRRITVYGRDQRVLGQWTKARDFYFAWIDSVLMDDAASIICDSNLIAGFFVDYRRDGLVTGIMIHGVHLEHDEIAPFGALARYRIDALTGAPGLDIVGVLTEGQRDDIEAAHLTLGNVAVLPNACSPRTAVLAEARDPASGIIVARLEPIKRIAHAVQAVAAIAATRTPPTIRIFGSGPEHDHLEELISRHGVESAVLLEGYSAQARDVFAEASFSLLTSKSEGQGMVILESMAAGCIPIAYDVPYGPASIITHGVDGFLVSEGDIAALADTIIAVMEMRAEDLEPMREAALVRSRDFRQSAITGRWADALRAAQTRKTPLHSTETEATVVACRIDGEHLVLSTEIANEHLDDLAISLFWKIRGTNRVRRSEARPAEHAMTWDLNISDFDLGAGESVDFWAEATGPGVFDRHRLAHSAAIDEATPYGPLEAYATKLGNFSLRRSGDPHQS